MELFAGSAIKQMELGWLVESWPFGYWVVAAIEVLIALYAIRVMLRPRSRHQDSEEKQMFMFLLWMIVIPVGGLMGIGCWFATVSVTLGIGCGVSFFLATLAFFLRD